MAAYTTFNLGYIMLKIVQEFLKPTKNALEFFARLIWEYFRKDYRIFKEILWNLKIERFS